MSCYRRTHTKRAYRCFWFSLCLFSTFVVININVYDKRTLFLFFKDSKYSETGRRDLEKPWWGAGVTHHKWSKSLWSAQQRVDPPPAEKTPLDHRAGQLGRWMWCDGWVTRVMRILFLLISSRFKVAFWGRGYATSSLGHSQNPASWQRFWKIITLELGEEALSNFRRLAHAFWTFKYMPKYMNICLKYGYCGASGKVSVCQCRRYKRFRFDPWVGKIPWGRKW